MTHKPKLGQNFLRDQQAITRIAASLGNLAGRTVVEIGPGHGAITEAIVTELARHPEGRLEAVEFDPVLAAALRVRFLTSSFAERLTVHHENVLKFDFSTAIHKPVDGTQEKLIVVGNLPYYITSDILLKLAASHEILDRAVLMVQREVAERVAARPSTRDYGVLSVTVQMYGPVEQLFTLPPEAFSPAPEVHSTVFRWRFAPRFEELKVPEQPFIAFIKQAFAQKRKTLANNLRAAKFAPDQIQAALAKAAIEPQARTESLDLAQLAALWRALFT